MNEGINKTNAQHYSLSGPNEVSKNFCAAGNFCPLGTLFRSNDTVIPQSSQGMKMAASPCIMTNVFNPNNNIFNFIDFQRLFQFNGVNTNSTDLFTSDLCVNMCYSPSVCYLNFTYIDEVKNN